MRLQFFLKLGGIYGHFFNDLSENVKQMVLSKYNDNKYLIQLEVKTTKI